MARKTLEALIDMEIDEDFVNHVLDEDVRLYGFQTVYDLANGKYVFGYPLKDIHPMILEKFFEYQNTRIICEQLLNGNFQVPEHFDLRGHLIEKINRLSTTPVLPDKKEEKKVISELSLEFTEEMKEIPADAGFRKFVRTYNHKHGTHFAFSTIIEWYDRQYKEKEGQRHR